MLSSSTPYDIEKTDSGEITLTLETEQFTNHSRIEGYGEVSSIGMTVTTRNAIIQQVIDDLNNGTPFVRFKQELSSLSTAAFTTQFVVFIGLWSILQLFVVPFGFGIPITSDSWLSLFVLSSENIQYIWTWVTSIFSHGGLLHLLVNSLVIISFGYLIEDELKRGKFIAFFFISAILAGVIQVGVVSVFGSDIVRVLGASGGAAALMGCASVFYPKMRIFLFLIIPIELWKAVIFFLVGSSLLVVVYGFGAWNVAHTAHIAGLLFGLGYGTYHQRYSDGSIATMFEPSEYRD